MWINNKYKFYNQTFIFLQGIKQILQGNIYNYYTNTTTKTTTDIIAQTTLKSKKTNDKIIKINNILQTQYNKI